jgi:recombinational DNA repair ATPase RecF
LSEKNERKVSQEQLRQICDNLEETFNKTRNELSEKLSDSFSLNEQLGERVRELESDLDEALARDRRAERGGVGGAGQTKTDFRLRNGQNHSLEDGGK